MKFITVIESHYQSDLVVLKSRLESEGIECRFKNELTTQVLNYIPSFLVELQIPEEDVPRAKEIMTETGDLQVENVKLVCPKCGSEKVKLKVSVLKWIQLGFQFYWQWIQMCQWTNYSKKRNIIAGNVVKNLQHKSHLINLNFC